VTSSEGIKKPARFVLPVFTGVKDGTVEFIGERLSTNDLREVAEILSTDAMKLTVAVEFGINNEE